MIPLFLEPEFVELPRLPFVRVEPEDADLSATSLSRFLKLLSAYGLTIRIQATKAYTEPTFYLSKSKTHNIGDVKAPAKEIECVFVTGTDMERFGVTATWEDGSFVNAFVGGQKSGHRPAALFTQITKLRAEVERCFKADLAAAVEVIALNMEVEK